jgi:hypothetical protein
MLPMSEAILLGSSQIRWLAGTRGHNTGAGCALGMAEIANQGSGRYRGAETIYPWLTQEVSSHLPCGRGHKYYDVSGFHDRYSTAIAHIFNEHVMGDHTWSIEQLADWVRSVEPPATKEEVVVQPHKRRYTCC